MPKDDQTSFAAAVQMATQVPQVSNEGANIDLPQLFQHPLPKNDLVVDDEPAPDAKRIDGVPAYRLRVHLQRFIVGAIVTEHDGQISVDDHDDTAAYEEVQNACATGKAILCWEKVNFLKDGGLVIALKWMIKHDPKEYDRLYGSEDDSSTDSKE